MVDFDRQAIIRAIETASVPHEGSSIIDPLGQSSRSLGYYMSVGIDHYRHDHSRYEKLLELAADAAIASIAEQQKNAARGNPEPTPLA